MSCKTLVLCRTPFQAVVVKQVLKEERIDAYDLVYYTLNNSQEDRFYFSELSERAYRTQYLFLKGCRYDILNHVMVSYKLDLDIKNAAYSRILVSSVDIMAFRRMSCKKSVREVISFDDGAAHINPYFNRYTVDSKLMRVRIYEAVFHVPSKQKFIKNIARHYSVYPGYQHVMPSECLRYVDLFEFEKNNNCQDGVVSFFIGQPFSEDGMVDFTKKVESYLHGVGVDYYVRHPRETEILSEGYCLLDKQGRIAEEAIFEICKGKRPVIYGTFSSVLINIPASAADKIMLLSQGDALHRQYARLGEKAGCNIVYL